MLSTREIVVTILMMSLGTMVTRFLPFIFFPDNKKTPEYILYLGKALPFAVMGLLIVYCLKDVTVTKHPYGMPEMIAIVGIIILHLWKGKALLSIGAGTVIYMIMVQFVFV
ncbi:MAG: AzlD domain-containing protein [Acholeplasmataceae bacterium]